MLTAQAPTPVATRTSVSSAVFGIGGLYSRSNGIAWIMRDLAEALGRAGVRVDVFAAACLGKTAIGDLFEPPTRFVTARGLWLGGLSVAPGLRPRLEEAMRTAAVVHNHSFWMMPTSQATRAAKRRGKPVVFTAHGALEPYSLSRSRWKKAVCRALFQSRDFAQTDCIHVNSRQEADKVREAGFGHPLAVIPNGVRPVPADDRADPEVFLGGHPALRGRRLMLFMARLHQKKGLGHFIPAWAEVAERFPDWHLVVAGPDRGFEAEARRLAEDPRLAGRVTFTGSLHGEVQRAARTASELFVLPTFSEGFSMSLLEAMATGLPAVTTPGCNFPEAAAEGGASEYPATRDGMVAALEEMLALSPAGLASRGDLGRRLVERDYSWDRVAALTIRMYEWLAAGGGPQTRPEFVIA